MKIVFFSPHSAIWIHAFPEALVAETLKQAGHEIVYVGCGRTFSQHCVCMSAQRVGADRSEVERFSVCNSCDRNKDIIRGQFGLSGYDLNSVLTADDLGEAERIVGAVTPETFLQLTLDGVEVGRAALSTFLLSYKRINLKFTEQEWSVFRIELVNTVRSFLACRRVLKSGASGPCDSLFVGLFGQSCLVSFGREAWHSILLYERGSEPD